MAPTMKPITIDRIPTKVKTIKILTTIPISPITPTIEFHTTPAAFKTSSFKATWFPSNNNGLHTATIDDYHYFS
jgi:hypothetical protein